MYYAKLNNEKKVERYPYTLTDLKLNTPGVSFADNIDEETIARFGLVLVKPASPPPETHTVNLTRVATLKKEPWGEAWVEEWIATPATPEQIQERIQNCANAVRQERNQYLVDSDWTQLSDAPVDSDAWATYRQVLRDITKQSNFPWDIIWPEIP
jgi:hypothetical protein